MMDRTSGVDSSVGKLTGPFKRTALRTSRLMEFLSRKELIAQTGHQPSAWPLVVLKELLDNSLDACEDGGIAPDIFVNVDSDGILVSDNGPGTPPEVVVNRLFPTHGPQHRFKAILFIEKEGFLPLFQKTKLAERYDVAVMSTKGLSVTASRRLVDHLCAKYNVPLLVLHDFDKSGFSIVGTLQRDTRRYSFRNKIKVIDLGLRLDDVVANNLESKEVRFKASIRKVRANLRRNGATDEEADFLCGYQRVELNAFTSANLVRWIEAKLEQHGIKKVVPADDVLEQAYRREMQVSYVREKSAEIEQQAKRYSEATKVPKALSRRVKSLLKSDPSVSWDRAVATIVEEGSKR